MTANFLTSSCKFPIAHGPTASGSREEQFAALIIIRLNTNLLLINNILYFNCMVIFMICHRSGSSAENLAFAVDLIVVQISLQAVLITRRDFKSPLKRATISRGAHTV